MPRPGPRPYECVRRAWHSDRHQPIRGSIIQQIFRVVTEAHSSNTRKNREWQEKLPRVVLKAEEIMYSKANSEEEYSDQNTLWERLNDAINTIIRRDESTETGQFLQPCIEAALILGCVPVRASRGQRHSNPRSYLSPRFQEPAQEAAVMVVSDRTSNQGLPSQSPSPSANQLSMAMPTMGNQGSSFPQPCSQIPPNNSYIASQSTPNLHPYFPRPLPPPLATGSNSSMNSSSVYPLYYGNQFQNVHCQSGVQLAQNSNRDNIIVGRPVGWHGSPPGCFTSMRNLLPGDRAGTEADRHEEVKQVDSGRMTVDMDCDLSLRLGPSEYGTNVSRCSDGVKNEGGSSSNQGTSEWCKPYTKNPELCFFPMHHDNDQSRSHSNRRESEDEAFDRNTSLRKRKAANHCELEDGRTHWLPGQIQWPGR